MTGRPRRDAGFTLLELVAVLAILSFTAYVALDSVASDTNQARFDDTRRRLEMIRAAVIGYPERTVNGQPDIRGFATDMGRLPKDLRELVEGTGQDGAALPPWTQDETTGVGSGWRGPYLSVFREASSGTRAFRDGWGNPTEAVVQYQSLRYGWKTFDGTAGLVVQSYGADGTANPAAWPTGDDSTVYTRDYPPPADEDDDPDAPPEPIVTESEVWVSVTSIPVRFINRTGLDLNPGNICARLSYPDNGALAGAGSAVVTLGQINSGDSASIVFTFTTPTRITAGMRTLRILAHDGDCDAGNSEMSQFGGAKRVLFLPPNQATDIDWTIRTAS